MTVIHVVTEQDIADHRPALVAWAEANELNPKLIDPHGLTIERRGDRLVIVYDEYLVDELGHRILDLTGPNRFERVRRTRPLRHALPEGIGRPVCACALGRPDPDCTDHPSDTEGDRTPGDDPLR